MQPYIMLGCVKKKADSEQPAKDLYLSTHFKYALAYARTLTTDENIFILSAKYGLLRLEDRVKPYDVTLNSMRVAERRSWAEMVLEQMDQIDLDRPTIFLAGKNYREFVMPHFSNASAPMRHMGIGKQLQFMKKNA